MTVSLVCPIFLSLILSLLVTALSLVFPIFIFFDPVSIGDGSFSCLPYLSFLCFCLYWWRLFLLSALSFFSLILSLLVTALSLVCPIFLFFVSVSIGDGFFSCLPFLFFDPVSICDGAFSCLPYLSFLWSCLYLWRLFLLSSLSFFSLIPVSIGDGSFSCLPYLSFLWSCLYWWRLFLLSALSFFSLILSLLVTAVSLVCPIFLFFDPVSIGDGSFSCLPYLSFLWSCLYWWWFFLLSALSFFSLILSLLVTAIFLVCPFFLFFDPVSIGDGSFSCLPYLSFLWSCLCWWRLFLLSALSFFSLILSLLVTALSLVCPIFLFFDPVSIGDGSFSCLPYLSFLWSCLYWWRLFLLSALSFFSLIMSLFVTVLSLVCPIFLFFDLVSIGDGSFSCLPYLSFLWSCLYLWRLLLLSTLSFFSLILSLLVTAPSLVHPIFLFFDPVSVCDGSFSCLPYLSFLWSCLYWWRLFLLSALSFFSLILSLFVTAPSLVHPIFLFFDPVSIGDGSFSCLSYFSFLWSCLYWWRLFLLSALSFFSLIPFLLVTAFSLVCPVFLFFDPVSVCDGSFSCLPYLSFLWSCLYWWRPFLLSALSFFSLILSLLVTVLSLVYPIFLFFDPVSIGDGSFSCLPYLSFLWSCLYWWQLFFLFVLSFFSLILSLLVTALSLVCPIFLFFDPVSVGDGSFYCLPYLSFLWSCLYWWRLFLLSVLFFFTLILSLLVTALSLVCPIFLFFDPVSIGDGFFSCLPCLSFLWSCLCLWWFFLLSALSFFSLILSLLVTALSLVCPIFLFFDPVSICDGSFSCPPYLSFLWSCLYWWRLLLLSTLSFFSLILSLFVTVLSLVCPIFLFFDLVSIGDGSFSCLPYLSFLWSCLYLWRLLLLSTLSFFSLILSLLVTALSLVCPIFLFFDPVSIGDGSFSCLPYLSFLWSRFYWWRIFLLSALSFFSLILSLFVTALSLVCPIFLFFDPVSTGDGPFSCLPYLSFLWSCLYWWRFFLLSTLSFFSLILSLLVMVLSLVCPIFLFFDPVSIGDSYFSCLPYLCFLWSCLYWWRLFLLSALSFFSLILSLLDYGSFYCLPYLSFLWSCLYWWRLFLLSVLFFFSLILSLLVTALSLVCPIFLFFDLVSIGDGSFSCPPYLSFLWSRFYWWRLFLLSALSFFSLILSLFVTVLSLVCPVFLFFDLVSIGDGSFSCLPYLSFLWSCLYLWRLLLLSTLSFFSLILSLLVTALSLVCPIFLFFDPVSIGDGSLSCLSYLSFLGSCLCLWRLFLLSTLSFFSLILSLFVMDLSLVYPVFLFFDPVSIGDGSFSCLPYLSFLWSRLYWWRLFFLSTLSFFSLILSLFVTVLSLVCRIFLFFDPVSIGDGSFSCLPYLSFFYLVSISDGSKWLQNARNSWWNPKMQRIESFEIPPQWMFSPACAYLRTVWDSTISSSMHVVRSAAVWTTGLGKIPLTKDRNSSKLSFLGLHVSKGFPYYCHTQYSAPRSRSYLWVKYWYWKTLQKK